MCSAVWPGIAQKRVESLSAHITVYKHQNYEDMNELIGKKHSLSQNNLYQREKHLKQLKGGSKRKVC